MTVLEFCTLILNSWIEVDLVSSSPLYCFGPERRVRRVRVRIDLTRVFNSVPFPTMRDPHGSEANELAFCTILIGDGTTPESSTIFG